MTKKDEQARNRLRLAQQEQQRQAVIRQQMERDRQARLERDAEIQRQLQLQREREQARQAAMRDYVISGNRQVRVIVDQVLQMRIDHNNPGINAGRNNEGDTEGGNENPLAINVPGNPHGITLGDVVRRMNGFDNSDSGLFKFRISGVFVHGR